MEKGNIYKKLLECKKQIGTVAKNAKNPHFKNTYADINALIEAVEPILLENGLIMLQPVRDNRQFTEIHDAETGEKVESYLEINPSLPSQALGSQLTYFRRYTLSSLLSLMSDDDDGQHASQPQPKPAFTSDMFTKAYEAGASIDAIKTKYAVSAEMEKAYNLFVKGNK